MTTRKHLPFVVLLALLGLPFGGGATSYNSIAWFAYGSADLNDEGKASVRGYLAVHGHPHRSFRTIAVVGHVDCAEAVREPADLGERRALAVRDFLAFMDVRPGRFAVRDAKDGSPLVQLSECVPEPQNRQVEWFLLE